VPSPGRTCLDLGESTSLAAPPLVGVGVAKRACGQWIIRSWKQASRRWSKTRLSPQAGITRTRAEGAHYLCMQRCRPLPADTAPARSSVRGERDSAAGTARTIEIVAFQYRECRRPGDSYVPQCDSDAVAGREDQSDGRGCTWHLAPRAQRPSPCQKQPSAFAVDRSRNFSSVTALCANSGGAIRRLLGRPFACACAPRAGGPGRPETAQACYVCGRSEAVDDDRADVLLEVPRPVPRFVVHEEVGLPLLA
jgi:hypothetical protein